MSKLQKSDRELLFVRIEAYKAWIAQIEKDLQFDWGESSKSIQTWEEIIQVISDRLQDLERESRLSEILYQVDLNEVQLRAEMMSGKWDSWLKLLATKVAEREALKVIFRFQYAGKW